MAGYYLNAIIILESCNHKKRSELSTTPKISLETIPSSSQPSGLKESGLIFLKSTRPSKDRNSSSEPGFTMSEEKEITVLLSSDKTFTPFKPVPSNPKPHPRK